MIGSSIPMNAKPGVYTTYTTGIRELFYGNTQDVRYVPGGVTINGTLSGNPQNTPYVWHLWAGQAFGKVTATSLYATSILGANTTAVASGDTTITTSAATATEIVRRIGASGTNVLKITGPPTAAGTVAVTSVTHSAINTTTGVITISAIAVAKVAGSWLQPADGSETIVSLLTDSGGIQVADLVQSSRMDVFDPRMWAGGGIVNVASMPEYPADASLKAYMKAALRVNIPDAKFSDDLTNT